MAQSDELRLLWTPLLRRQGRSWLQAVGVVGPASLMSRGAIHLAHGSRRSTVRTAELTPWPWAPGLAAGESAWLWLVPRPARAVTCRAELRPERGRSLRAELTLRPAEPVRCHVTLALPGEDGMDSGPALARTSGPDQLFDELLQCLDSSRAHAERRTIGWAVSPWLLEAWLDSKRTSPAQRRRLEQHLRAGRTVWGLMPFTPHSELLGFEPMCRCLYAARRLAERFARPVPTAARLAGVAAHTASLGMALVAAGGTFLEMASGAQAPPAALPPLFWWKLPDGGRILTHAHAGIGTALLPTEHWPWNEWPAVQVVGRPFERQLDDIVEQTDWLARHFDAPTFAFGRPEDFAAAVMRRHGRMLPVCDKELIDPELRTAATWPAGLQRDYGRLASAEVLQTLSSWCAQTEPDRSAAAQSTPDTLTGHGRTVEVLASCARRVPAVVTQEVKAEVRRIAEASARRFTARLSLPASNGLSVLLFNTLSWRRGGPVRLVDARLPAAEFDLMDADTGGPVPYERTAGGIEFFAPPVPPCGHLRLELKPVTHRVRAGQHADWEPRNLVLHTNETTLQFHEKGGLARWHDRRHSVQWCLGTAEHPTGCCLPRLSDGPADVGPSVTPLYSRVVVETGGDFARNGRAPRPDRPRCRITYTLYRNRRELYVNIAICGDPGTRAGERYAFFPVAVEKPYVLVDRIAHLTTPEDDLAKGVDAACMAVHHGIRVEGDHAGMNFYGLDTPLVWFGMPDAKAGNAAPIGGNGQAAHGSAAVRKDRNVRPPSGAYPDGTLCALLPGITDQTHHRGGDPNPERSFDFILHPTANDGWDGGLSKLGWEYARPLVAVLAEGQSVRPSGSLLSIEPTVVQLVTLKPADFADGTCLRLWNSLLDPAEGLVTLPESLRRGELWRCDLLERPVKRIPLDRQGRARVSFRPHEIVTTMVR